MLVLAGHDGPSSLRNVGQRQCLRLYVCRDNLPVVVGACGPQAPFSLDWTELEGSCSEGEWVLAWNGLEDKLVELKEVEGFC